MNFYRVCSSAFGSNPYSTDPFLYNTYHARFFILRTISRLCGKHTSKVPIWYAPNSNRGWGWGTTCSWCSKGNVFGALFQTTIDHFWYGTLYKLACVQALVKVWYDMVLSWRTLEHLNWEVVRSGKLLEWYGTVWCSTVSLQEHSGASSGVVLHGTIWLKRVLEHTHNDVCWLECIYYQPFFILFIPLGITISSSSCHFAFWKRSLHNSKLLALKS